MRLAVQLLSIVFFILAAAGVVLVVSQAWYVRRFLKRPPRRPRQELPTISVLKPLCGLDEGLAENLRSFEELDYPEPIVDHDDAVAEFRARREG